MGKLDLTNFVKTFVLNCVEMLHLYYVGRENKKMALAHHLTCSLLSKFNDGIVNKRLDLENNAYGLVLLSRFRKFVELTWIQTESFPAITGRFRLATRLPACRRGGIPCVCVCSVAPLSYINPVNLAVCRQETGCALEKKKWMDSQELDLTVCIQAAGNAHTMFCNVLPCVTLLPFFPMFAWRHVSCYYCTLERVPEHCFL